MKHELLNTNWEQIFENLNTQCMWSVFHSKVLLLIDKYIPTCIFKSNSKPKWLDSSTLKLIKQKHKAWNTYKATQHYADFISYTRSKNVATASIRKAKSTFESNLAISVKNNPSLFWKYVRNNAKVVVMSLP